MTEIYRQGDVLIRRVRRRPRDARAEVQDGRLVLARGEVTGHAHVITEPDAGLLSVSGQVDRWLRVRTKATLVHEEHAPITLPRGIYRVSIQREWSDAMKPRAVLD